MDSEPDWFRWMTPEALGRVTVVAVDPDSPAEDSGLRKGDVILAVDGSEVRTPHDVVSAVSSAEPGDELKLTISRPEQDSEEDDELEISVTLAEHPEEGERAYLGVSLGFRAIGLRRFGGQGDPEQWREEYGLRENWDLPFDLPELPEHWELPFDLKELPDQFQCHYQSICRPNHLQENPSHIQCEFCLKHF